MPETESKANENSKKHKEKTQVISVKLMSREVQQRDTRIGHLKGRYGAVPPRAVSQEWRWQVKVERK